MFSCMWMAVLVGVRVRVPLVMAPVLRSITPRVLSRLMWVPVSVAPEMLEMPRPVVCMNKPAPLATEAEAVAVPLVCKYRLPVDAADVMAVLTFRLPAVVLPILSVPALTRLISALLTPSVRGVPVSTSAPPTSTKVPAVRF